VGNVRIVSEPQAGSQAREVVRQGINLFNVAATGDANYSPLAIFLKDDRGAILGGALGDLWGGWLDLSSLWVAEPIRGQGYGTKLLEAAEEGAKQFGCTNVFLTTFSFQARPFYERFGYEVVADIPNYPIGHTYHVLKKTLT
jgi:GNAT superfamily N-acetyltransferase